ncbi:MAG: IS1634 family transposase [Candidatus Anstonellales archaeon]
MYIYVVSNYREKNRIRQKVHAYIGREQDLPSLLLNSTKMKLLLESDIENLLYQASVSLWRLLEETKIPEIFATYFKKEWGVEQAIATSIMILNYAIDRKSKRKLQEWYKQTYLPYLSRVPVEKINEDLLYRTLDFFNESNIEQLHGEIFKNVKEKFNLSDESTFYDLTTVTFEGNKCDIAKKGYNPEALNKLQINVGLAVTKEKFPITHKVFEGNEKDVTTLKKIIKMIDKLSDISKTIFIFDRGISSEKNLTIIEDKGAGYIAGLPKKSTIKKLIISLEDNQFTEIDAEISFYEYKKDNRRIIIYWNKKLQEDQKKLREEKLQRIIKKLEKLKQNFDRYKKERAYERIGEICGKMRKFFSIRVDDSLAFSINEKRLKEIEKSEGKYAIITNTNLNAKEILEHYRDKNLVELSFKDLKLFVDIRPVRHWKENRVLAHIFLAVLAFGLRSLLELKLRRAGIDITAEGAISKLNQVRALCVKGKILKLTGETEEIKRIVEALEQ